jgi:hypothetical protein
MTLDGSGLWLHCCDVLGGAAGILTTNGGSVYYHTAVMNADPLFCDPATLDLGLFNTSPCAAANSGGCYLIGAKDVACEQTGVDDQAPAANRLYQCHPNPFNPTTKIEFDIQSTAKVSIRIFDVTGRLVRVLVDETLDAGRHDAVWDGTNESGAKAASGTYFCRMTAGSFTESRKLILLR